MFSTFYKYHILSFRVKIRLSACESDGLTGRREGWWEGMVQDRKGGGCNIVFAMKSLSLHIRKKKIQSDAHTFPQEKKQATSWFP